MTATNDPTVVGYTRLSQESDRSIASQKQNIRDYCSEHGLKLVRVFNEGEQASGYDTDRPEYQALLDYLAAEDIAGVVVRDLSRLSRDAKERIRILLDLDDQDVALHSVDRGQIDLSDPFALTRETAQADADDAAKRQEIEKAKKEVQKRVENGYYHGQPPYGLQFDADKRYLEPDPDEFETVQTVLQQRDSGASYRDIAGEVSVSAATCCRIVERRNLYEQHLEGGHS